MTSTLNVPQWRHKKNVVTSASVLCLPRDCLPELPSILQCQHTEHWCCEHDVKIYAGSCFTRLPRFPKLCGAPSTVPFVEGSILHIDPPVSSTLTGC